MGVTGELDRLGVIIIPESSDLFTLALQNLAFPSVLTGCDLRLRQNSLERS